MTIEELTDKVAQLEQQIKALTDAQPTEYYTFKRSGEEMDALFDKVETLM